jgi:ubiquitin carboxyl-terminal hydrolase 30
MRWFCVSDSQVEAVSVEDVLSAEASLLFYERIPNN